jgi:hypothetical protein
VRRFCTVRSYASLVLALGLVFSGVARAVSASDCGFEPSRNQQLVRSLGDHATLAAAPRLARVHSASSHRIQADGPAQLIVLPRPASAIAHGLQIPSFPRSIAATPHSGRSPPRFL